MDLNLPFGSAAWEPRWKRRRSERGAISIAVRALLELPKEIVEKILRLANWRFLEYTPGPTFLVQQKGWAGTQRMLNRRRLISRYVSNNKRVGWLQEVTDLRLLRSDAPIDVD